MVSNCSHNAGVEPYDSVCYKKQGKGGGGVWQWGLKDFVAHLIFKLEGSLETETKQEEKGEQVGS